MSGVPDGDQLVYKSDHECQSWWQDEHQGIFVSCRVGDGNVGGDVQDVEDA